MKQGTMSFFSNSLFNTWKGKTLVLAKLEDILNYRKLKFSNKAIKYIVPKIYKAWRAAIRKLRKEWEDTKSNFYKVKHLILMNPINMKPYYDRKLRKYMIDFPWLRSYRQILHEVLLSIPTTPRKKNSLRFLPQ